MRAKVTNSPASGPGRKETGGRTRIGGGGGGGGGDGISGATTKGSLKCYFLHCGSICDKYLML